MQPPALAGQIGRDLPGDPPRPWRHQHDPGTKRRAPMSDLTDDSVIDDSDSYIDEKEDVTLDERAADAFAITAVQVGPLNEHADCPTFKYIGYGVIETGSNNFSITGTFPATQPDSTVLTAESKKGVSAGAVSITSWSATSIIGTITLPALAAGVERKNGSIKLIRFNPSYEMEALRS